MSIVIPQHLILAGARFVLVGKNSKAAIEPGWEQLNNYDAASPRLLEHIQNGGNYGVLLRDGLCVIDIDDPVGFKNATASAKLPKSFIVMRGGGKSGHYYFKCPDCPDDMRKKHHVSWGDIRLGGNFYMVGPGCTAPTRDDPPQMLTYDVVSSIPPAEIPFDTIKAIIYANRVEETHQDPNIKPRYVCPEKIRMGERHTELVRAAGKLIAANLPSSSVRDAIAALNQDRFDPPFSPAELDSEISAAYISLQRKEQQKAERKAQKQQDAQTRKNAEGEDRERAEAERQRQVDQPDADAKAREIYQDGKFVEYCREAFSRTWYGDQHILDAILLQAAALSISNISSGINIHIAGKTQSGKSDACRHALKFIPDRLKYSGTFSRLALYHSKKFHDQMIVFSDDTSFDPETAAILRGILTAWEEGTERETLVGKEWATVKVPKRLNMILTSVESVSIVSDDAQDESRFITLEILRDPTTESAIRKFIQESKPDISAELDIVSRVWDIMPYTEVKLHKTIETELPFREFTRYLTMIAASAHLNNRTVTDESDIRFVDTLIQRSRPMISGDIAGLTKNEKAVLDYLKSKKGNAQSVRDIQASLRVPINNVYRAIRGRIGTIQAPTGGLLMKERHVTIIWLDGSREWGIQYF